MSLSSMSSGISSCLAVRGESLPACLAHTRDSLRSELVSRSKFSLWMQGRGEGEDLLDAEMACGRGLLMGDCAFTLYMFLFSKYKSNNRHKCQ